MDKINKLSDEDLIMEFIREVRIFVHDQYVRKYGIDLYHELMKRYVYQKFDTLYGILYHDDYEVIKYIDCLCKIRRFPFKNE
jgi:hypothetical protein